jgi:probable rRNA maturation factor
MVRVSIYDEQNDFFISKSLIRDQTIAILENLKVFCDEIAVHFVTAKTISKLHKDFFNDPSITDCISFPVDEKNTPNSFLGEIFICPKVALSYAKKHKIAPKNEVSLYLIHGLLHLVGFDDQKKEDKRMMKKMEKRCMDLLKESNLLKDG